MRLNPVDCVRVAGVPLNAGGDCTNLLLDALDIAENSLTTPKTVTLDGLEVGLMLTALWMVLDCVPLSYDGDTENAAQNDATQALIDKTIDKLLT